MLTMLIVDDNPMDREGVQHLIPWNQLGIEVIGSAINGEEGLRKCLELKPDMVITDVAMPVMDGIQMAGAIRAELPDTRFLFMSCFDEFSYVKNALKYNAHGYVLKPIKTDEMMEAVGKAIADIQHERLQSNRLTDLRVQVEQSMPVLRERFIQELVFQTGHYDQASFSERLRFLGIAEDRMFTIVHIGLEMEKSGHPGGAGSVDHFYLTGCLLRNRFADTFAARYENFVIMQDLTAVSFMLFFDDWKEEDSISELLGLVDQYKEAVTTELEAPVLIVIGDFMPRLQEAYLQYEQIKLATSSRFYSGANRIILVSEVKAQDTPPEYDLKALRLQLAALLETEHTDGKATEAFLNTYFASEYRYPSYFYKGLSFAIVTVLHSLLLEKNESLLSVMNDMEGIWKELEHSETVEGIRGKLTNIIHSVCGHLSRSHVGKYGKIVADIKELVDQNYGAYTNVEQVVMPLYLSAAHANAIFKQQTGKTIFEYLIDKKIEVAKQKLRDPYIKIYEVAEHIGYRSKSYFTTVFKEYTGMTPKQYMDLHSGLEQ